MTQSHYSLRWNNHQSHILAAFDALLQAETLVDVTLVCAETSVRAHKVVLSACSPFFQRIFAENPCKHPVIVLKDFNGWEVQAIVDFMYKGEISVGQEQLQSLIKAAESLQVRGLASQDPFVDRPPTTGHESIVAQTPTPSASPTTEPFCCAGGRDQRGSSPFSPIPVPGGGADARRLAFPFEARGECQSPVPRRKQARPRRRSGELGVDLSGGRSPDGEEMLAENLCVKRKEEKKDDRETPPRPAHHHRGGRPATPDPPGSTRSPDSLDGPRLEYRGSPGAGPQQQHAPPTSIGAALNLKRELEDGAAAVASALPFPPMPSVSALAMTQPPHTKFFGLDSPLGLFPPGLDRNPLFDMPDPRTTPDAQMFAKKKNSLRGNFPVGRPKGQHSAPRGGPPRSWTNAELTEALQHVWNKKMTTSQASRIFGIPYNSLLMYVRGKYGKSLKLEQLRKDCIGEGGPTPPMDILSMGGGNNNNTPCKPERDQEPQQNNNRPPSREVQENQPQHPIFNPFQPSFYPDFGTGFPIPVSMVHLLPQSEKSRDGHYMSQPPAPHAPPADDDLKKEEEEYERPAAMQADDHRRELVHQNGQD